VFWRCEIEVTRAWGLDGGGRACEVAGIGEGLGVRRKDSAHAGITKKMWISVSWRCEIKGSAGVARNGSQTLLGVTFGGWAGVVVAESLG